MTLLNIWLTLWPPIVQALGTAGITIATMHYQHKQRMKSIPDIRQANSRKDKIRPILEELRYEMGCTRCCEWAVSNGDVTLSGHHLQKLSIVTECNDEGIENIQSLFQLIPISQFTRTIDELRTHPTVVTYENTIKDDLAALNMSYDIVTLIQVRIHGDYDKWVGILSVAWNKERTVTAAEMAFIKLQAARIGATRR